MKYTVNIAPEIHDELQAISDDITELAEDSAVGEKVVKAIAQKFFR